MAQPERFTVGHPFNPVYLLPLVELCGGERTAPETVRRAAEVYRGLGMRPLVLRKEVDAFVADRLLEALWREALWLVADDVATVEEVDDAIRFGAGLRWAFMGTFLTYRIAGGEAGMRHFMAQFGPALQLPWTKLTDVPELTGELLDKLVAQSDAQAAGRSTRELERLRDDCLVSVLQGLRRTTWRRARRSPSTSGRCTRARPPRRPRTTAHRCGCTPPSSRRSGSTTTGTRTRAATCRCSATRPTRCCATSGSRSTAATTTSRWRRICRTWGRRARGSGSTSTTQLLGHDGKRIHLFHALHRTGDDVLLATAEQMLLHVDAATGRAAPAAPAVLERVGRIAAAHADAPAPRAGGARDRELAARRLARGASGVGGLSA